MKNASLMMSILVYLLSALHALLIFVVDEQTGDKFHTEPSPEATVGDLRAEIASIKGVDTAQIEVSFQGQTLTDMNVPLADTGMSDECTCSVRPMDPVIELKCTEEGAAQTHCLDVLQLDTSRDITQIAHNLTWQDVTYAALVVGSAGDPNNHIPLRYDVDVYGISRGVCYTVDVVRNSSHSIFISRIGEQLDESHLPPPKRKVKRVNAESAKHLLMAKYAIKDLWVEPAPHESLLLQITRRVYYLTYGVIDRTCSYQFPPGYGVLCRYATQNQTRN